jgi:uncharacterized membrane protein YgdD (TMEM256/DUF423 family)
LFREAIVRACDAMNHRKTFLAAGLFGATGVGLGAFGAHGLALQLAEQGTLHAWDTASRYHLLHAVALLGIAVWQMQPATPPRATAWAARCWCAGIVLFSGSLYWLALGGPGWLGPVTPLGGAAFIAGWLCVAAAAWSREK